MRVVLDLHEPVDADRAVLAHAPEVVPPQVDEHHVLGALLLVGEQLLGDLLVLGRPGAAGPGPGNRPGRRAAPADREQRLGARPDDLELDEIEEVHVRARVDHAQAAIDRKRVGRGLRGPALRGNDLEGVPGMDVLDDPADDPLELLAGHVGLEGGRRQDAALLLGDRPGQGTLHPGDALRGRIPGIADVGAFLDEEVHDHAERVLEVVEDDEQVAEHQRHVGETDHVGIWLPEGLDRPDEVVSEVAHEPAREGRQSVDGRLLPAPGQLLGEAVGVAAIPERPAQDLPGRKPDEAVAAKALALLGGLEQERRLTGGQRTELEEGRDRRLAVVDDLQPQGYQRVLPGQADRLVTRRPYRPWSPVAHRARSSSTRAASARLRPREETRTLRW